MIKLYPETLASHALASRLAEPPTHAALLYFRHYRNFGTVTLDSAVRATTGPQDSVSVVYAYGSLNSAGEFIADPLIPAIHTALGKNITVPEDPRIAASYLADDTPIVRHFLALDAKVKAYTHLVSPGVAPTPGEPHVPRNAPGKQAGFFKEHDLDAVFAVHDNRLKGEVVDTKLPA